MSHPYPAVDVPTTAPVIDLSKLELPPPVVRYGEQPWQVLPADRAGLLLQLLRAAHPGSFGNKLRDVLMSDRASEE